MDAELRREAEYVRAVVVGLASGFAGEAGVSSAQLWVCEQPNTGVLIRRTALFSGTGITGHVAVS